LILAGGALECGDSSLLSDRQKAAMNRRTPKRLAKEFGFPFSFFD